MKYNYILIGFKFDFSKCKCISLYRRNCAADRGGGSLVFYFPIVSLAIFCQL